MNLLGLERLSLQRLRARFRLVEGGRLPPFLGSAVRGAFGSALRQISCVAGCVSAATCARREACPYAVLFESPRPAAADRLRSQRDLPHPLVLEPPAVRDTPWRRGEVLEVGVILIGRAVAHCPFAIGALEEAGRAGLGPERRRLDLEAVVALTAAGAEVPVVEAGSFVAADALPTIGLHDLPLLPGGDGVTLCFETPLRLGGERSGPEAVDFDALGRALLRRLSSLAAFYGERPLEGDFAGLAARARTVETVRSELCPLALRRWSNRQRRHVPPDGVVGRIAFRGAALADFAPLLRLGERLRVGKGTVFGLGKYRLESVEA